MSESLQGHVWMSESLQGHVWINVRSCLSHYKAMFECQSQGHVWMSRVNARSCHSHCKVMSECQSQCHVWMSESIQGHNWSLSFKLSVLNYEDLCLSKAAQSNIIASLLSIHCNYNLYDKQCRVAWITAVEYSCQWIYMINN